MEFSKAGRMTRLSPYRTPGYRKAMRGALAIAVSFVPVILDWTCHNHIAAVGNPVSVKEKEPSSSLTREDEVQKKHLPGQLGSFDYEPQVLTDGKDYDYIVVGCGTTGCPLAATLADDGRSVLVIERGPVRSFETSLNAMEASRTGPAMDDDGISESYRTTQGVRTRSAAVMGGRTALYPATYAEESPSYFRYLTQALPKAQWDQTLIDEASSYVRRVLEKVATPVNAQTEVFEETL
ncbi:gmc oxidoreductase, partial [Cystoisospora suis]